jgi:hypothetical protein
MNPRLKPAWKAVLFHRRRRHPSVPLIKTAQVNIFAGKVLKEKLYELCNFTNFLK